MVLRLMASIAEPAAAARPIARAPFTVVVVASVGQVPSMRTKTGFSLSMLISFYSLLQFFYFFQIFVKNFFRRQKSIVFSVPASINLG